MFDDESYNSFVSKVKKNYKEKGIEYDDNSKKLIFLVEKGIKIPSLMIEIYQFFVDIENENQSEEELQKKLDQLYKQAKKLTK